MSRRLRAVLGAVVVLVLAADVFFLVSWSLARRGDPELRDRAETINLRLIKNSRSLDRLQDRSNEYRDDVGAAFDSMDMVLNLARAQGGAQIGAAREEFTKTVSLMDAARRANVRLPEVTTEAIEVAEKSRDDVRLLLPIVPVESDRRYLTAYDEALELMVATQNAYQQMNAKISESMVQYEVLFGITDRFLKLHASRGFRSDREASQSYTSSTRQIALAVATLRSDLSSLQRSTDHVGGMAKQAFRKASSLRPRG